MAKLDASSLDLAWAWDIVRTDITSGRSFVRLPHQVQVIDSDTTGWLATVESLVEDGYTFASAPPTEGR